MVQVVADAVRDDGLQVRSKPISVTIRSGLPDANHFSVGAPRRNYLFGNREGEIPVTAFVGDIHGNYVAPGTQVYFTTTGGIIEGASITDQSGKANTNLTPVNPMPVHPTFGTGYATVTARTADVNNQTIETSAIILFSGNTAISSDVTTLGLTRGGSQTVNFTVADQNGNPLVEGTEITVEADNAAMTLNGDTDVTLPDTQVQGNGTTNFSFTASYNQGGTAAIPATKVTITVSSPNGDAVYVITQPAIAEGESGSTGGMATSITLSSVSNSDIVVKESGGVEQSTITFVVRDVEGNPIDGSNAVDVTFSFGAQPNGGETLSITTVTTNAQGQAKTTLVSGSVSGVVQIIATATNQDGVVLRSRPASIVINSGLPSANHFSIAPSQFNFPGYNIFGLTMSLTAFVGDQYGNIVSPGTPVYFTTDGGLIEGSAVTDNLGRASVTLISALPRPTHPTLGAGFATITARTADQTNSNISTESVVLFSGVPVIQTATNSIDIPHQGSQTVDFTVTDQNGNPLAAGTTINVAVEGENMNVIGDVDVTLTDTQATGPGSTTFRFVISDSDRDLEETEPVQVTISVSGPNGGATRTINGVTRKIIPGGR